MALSTEHETSMVKLLDIDGTGSSLESEGEHGGKGGSRTIMAVAAGGGTGAASRRGRAAVVASVLLVAGCAAALLGLFGTVPKEEVEEALAPTKREPIALPPIDTSHGKLPEIEELFSMARAVHPDLDKRMEELSAEHGLPNMLMNKSAAIMDDPEEVLRHLKASMEPQISHLRSLQITSCFIDTWQLVLGIGSIVTNIRASMEACQEPYPETENKRNTCTAMVTLNLAMWAYLGTYICNMWSTCPGVFSKNATCALGPVGILSSTFTLANAGATMASNCKQGLTTAPPPLAHEDLERYRKKRLERNRLFEVEAFGGGRRLAPKEAQHARSPRMGVVGEFLKKANEQAKAVRENSTEEEEAEEEEVEGSETKKTTIEHIEAVHKAVEEEHKRIQDENWAIAACVFDTQKAVARVMQAITFIGFAAMDCREDVFKKKGHEAKDKCVIDIGIIIASLAIASNMISISMVNCPHHLEYMPDNLCAAGICNVISASGYVAVAFAGIHDSCKGIDPDGI